MNLFYLRLHCFGVGMILYVGVCGMICIRLLVVLFVVDWLLVCYVIFCCFRRLWLGLFVLG